MFSSFFQSDTLGLEPGHYIGDVEDLDPINGVFTVKREGLFLVTASVQLIKAPEVTPKATEAPATPELPEETEAPEAMEAPEEMKETETPEEIREAEEPEAMKETEEPVEEARDVSSQMHLPEVSVAVCIDATSDRCNE